MVSRDAEVSGAERFNVKNALRYGNPPRRG